MVAPTDVAVLDTAPGQSTLTLTTCNPRYSAATRLVVTASFDGESSPASSTPTTQPKPTQLAGEAETSSSLGGGSAPWVPAVFWGLLTVALAVAAVLLWRWLGRRAFRVLVIAVATPLVLLALLVWFEHISLALPGSF